MDSNVDCQLVTTELGWWLTFPAYPMAGLLFFTQQEQTDFAHACGCIGTVDVDALVGFDPTEIVSCPIEYLDKACNFTL